MKRIAVFLLLFNTAALYGQEESAPQVATADTLVVMLPALDTLVHDTLAATPPAAAPKHKTLRENKKLVAAICALPPFGLIGLHRIYLHSAPYVPVVYLCTLGGAGVLTMIDFVFILVKTPEEIEAEFEGNNKIFMWVK
jgi:hypothetical protein